MDLNLATKLSERSPTLHDHHPIHPIASHDQPALTNLLHSSKLSLTINQLLFKDWPNEAVQKPLYAGSVGSAFSDPAAECLKVVDDMSGDIVGYLVLSRERPIIEAGSGDAATSITSNPEVHIAPEGLRQEIFTPVMKASEEISEQMQGIDHFKLTYIVIKSSSRNRGLGSQLVRLCFDRAKAEGVLLAVYSEPAAHGFFVKMGFRDTRHVDFDLTKWAPSHSGFGVFRLLEWYGLRTPQHEVEVVSKCRRVHLYDT